MPSIAELIQLRQRPASPTFDVYNNAWGKEPSDTTTLQELIAVIRSGNFEEPVAKVRRLLADGKPDEASEAKRALPAVSLSGSVTGRRARAVEEGRFQHSGLLQIDLDAKDNPGKSVAQMRSVLIDDPRMVAVFITPSGNGVKGVARIPAEADTHRSCFLAAEAHFASLGFKIDPACKDPVRLCFVSHDPDALVNDASSAMFEPVELCAIDDFGDFVEGLDDSPNATSISETGNLVIRAGRTPTTPANVREMLKAIPPRPPYEEWLKIASAVWDALGEADGTAALLEWSPEETAGEYADKFKHRLKDVTAGTLHHRAKENGYTPDKKTKDATKATTAAKKIAAILEPDGITPSTMQQFRPEDIYYDAPGGKYLVKVGASFFTFSKSSPVATGITRHLAPKFKNFQDLQVAVSSALRNRELDGAVQWVGNIAGHQQGLSTDINGLPILITSEPALPQPEEGTCDTICGLLAGAFENPTAFEVFMGWLATRYRAVRSHVHIPSPMLVLAGEVNSGKSLIAWIASQVMGGRIANPYNSWSGGLPWNDDLVGSEMLLVDDCTASTDIRARRNFGAAFKEAIYPAMVQLRKRHASAIAVRPVWCVMVCCNDTPEALQIIPPLDADLSDKIALLHVTPTEMPVDTSTPDGRLKLQSMIRNEMPAFCAQLEAWEVADELKDNRSGIMAWRDPELAQAVEAHSPAKRLEDILTTAITNLSLWGDLPRDFTANEIQTRLQDPGSPVRKQADELFTWFGACGSALSKLVRTGSHIVEKSSYVKGTQRYTIHAPAEYDDE